MSPNTKNDTPKTMISSTERISRVCQKVRRRTEKAKEASARFSLRASPKPEASVLKEMSETLQQYIDDVTQPRYHQALKDVFKFDTGTRLTRCICLGLGPFDIAAGNKGVSQSSNRPTTSLHQLAVLTIILQILTERHSIQEVYFQDPAFSEAEKKFLKSLGYTVLEDPAAYEKMSASTFLFAPFLAYNVAASALAVSFPALYMGNSPAKVLESLRLPGANRVEETIEIFDQYQSAVVEGNLLPSFEQQTWTRRTKVLWLSPASAGGPARKA